MKVIGKNCLVFQSHAGGLCALLWQELVALQHRVPSPHCTSWGQRGCPELPGRWPASSPGLGCAAEFSDPLRVLPSPPWLCTEFSGQYSTARPPSPVVRAGSPSFPPRLSGGSPAVAEMGRKQEINAHPCPSVSPDRRSVSPDRRSMALKRWCLAMVALARRRREVLAELCLWASAPPAS